MVTYRVVCVGDIFNAWHIAELEQSHQGGKDCTKLHVSKLLTNAPMPSGTEREIGAISALVDQAVPIIDLFFIFRVLLSGFIPAVRVPLERLGEKILVSSGDTRRRKDIVRCWDHIWGTINWHWVLHSPNDRVNWRMNTESFLDNLGMKIQLLQAVIREFRHIGTKYTKLFLV